MRLEAVDDFGVLAWVGAIGVEDNARSRSLISDWIIFSSRELPDARAIVA